MDKAIKIVVITIISMLITSCNGSGGSSTKQNDSTLIEQQRQDSIHEANAKAETERIKKEQEEQARLDRVSNLPKWIEGIWVYQWPEDRGIIRYKFREGKVSRMDSNGNCHNWVEYDYIDGKIVIKAWAMKYEIDKSEQTLRDVEYDLVYYKDGVVNQNDYNSSSVNMTQEAQIMNQLHELGEKGKRMMPRIEALYRRQQQAQRQGILSNPQAQYDLNDAINELIDIKNEQIRLAEQLGDSQLVREYKEQRSKVYEAKDKMLYGR